MTRKPGRRQLESPKRAESWIETGLALALVIGLDRLGWLPRLGDGLGSAAGGSTAGTATTPGLLLVLLTLLVGLIDLLRPHASTASGRAAPIDAEPASKKRNPVGWTRMDREKTASGVREAWRTWRHG
ncbi:MAG: hypothetical protein QJR14_06660 [Bacillota bacterium]|nr:hypothetical protein [Bacillota bacterium]